MQDINRIVLTGRLTHDPERRALQSGSSVCKLRVAVTGLVKTDDGWGERPNYFDVTVWNGQGEAAAKHLSKGSPVAIDGRLEWREWEAQDSSKRQAIQIVAEQVRFLGPKPAEENATD